MTSHPSPAFHSPVADRVSIFNSDEADTFQSENVPASVGAPPEATTFLVPAPKLLDGVFASEIDIFGGTCARCLRLEGQEA